ncbi:hypothetical protein KAR91_09080 [Candidatus Pacearchaeota archaeon]|nr:hypothetical protein [Candidatus Pacearchaeota archaeon]
MKLALSIVSGLVFLIIAIGGVIWAAEDRYMDEGEAVQTIAQMQLVLEKRIDTLERKDLMQEFTFLTEQYYIFKDKTIIYPGDQEILGEFARIQKRRDIVKQKLGL